MESKEEDVLDLFFQNPTREWHFEEIIKKAGIARSKADAWLKKFMKEEIIVRIKKKGKMPYFISNYDSPSYKNRKRIYAMNKLYESGLLDHLLALKKAKTIIIFGSIVRSDWYENSDIDIFIYGLPEGLKIAKYETRLHRDIQLFICHEKDELVKYNKGLLSNIIKGNLIKGDLDFVKVDVNA